MTLGLFDTPDQGTPVFDTSQKNCSYAGTMSDLKLLLRPRGNFKPFRFYSEEETRQRRQQRIAIFLLMIAVFIAGSSLYSYYVSFFEKTRLAEVHTLSLPIVSKINAKVTKVFIQDAQDVKAGDSLVQFDSQEFQKQLDERKLELERSESQLAGGRASLAKLQKNISNNDEAAKKKYDDGQAWYVRLLNKNKELRERVDEASKQLRATLITAPSNGHIALKKVEVGMSVKAEDHLFDFVDSGRPWVIAQYTQTQLEKMKIGQSVEISVKGLNKTFTGKVETLPNNTNSSEVKNISAIEKTITQIVKPGAAMPVKIKFDEESVKSDINHLVNGSRAVVKVYVR